MIVVAGLGPGNFNCLTIEAWDAIKNAPTLYLRTAKHPCADDLAGRGVSFASFDKFYEELSSFAEVYEAIAQKIVQEAANGQEIIFAVPGSPLVAEKTVELIFQYAAEKNIEVKVIPGMSFLETLYARLKINPSAGLTVVDASDISSLPQNINTALVITQVFDRRTASEAKLSLMNYYNDQHPVTVTMNLGLADEKILNLPLYELDRQEGINHLTSVYVPPKKTVGQKFSFDPVVDIVAKLRSPGGCAWDMEQTPETLAGYMIEEIYEVLEAIDLNDSALLTEELGDVLLHIIFQARIAEEQGLFTIDDVVAGICEKMIRRHPHVFGDVKVKDAADVVANWDKIKKAEKEERRSYLDGIPKGAPSLLRAFKLQTNAAKAGFDWPEIGPVWDKVYEELTELKEAVDELCIIGDNWDKTKNAGKALNNVQSELGDAFFALVNLARFLHVDSETALSAANDKFTRRFHHMEKRAQEQNRSLLDFDLAGLDALWDDAKKFL